MLETHNCWWKERVFYEIYPRSFQDSNGDGIGDLRGIMSHLDYLQWLGVGAVWLCPINDSPNADMGYDIRDYETIMAEFGTMEDFDELVTQLHHRDIKLVMDLVVNHTSDEHPWFLEARTAKDSPYRDYYIWRDGVNGREPNNWASFFTPSAWTYDETTAQWYLHLFSEKQPDLDWENPKLRREIYGMMNRWLDRGVDGFRMDVVSLLAKDPQFPDGMGNGYVFSPEYFAFQPKLHNYLQEMRVECFDGRDCMCVGETSFVTTENAGSVVNDGRELDLLFQFDVMDMDSGETKWDTQPFDLMRFKQVISAWQMAIGWNTLFWGNHDQPRMVSRFGCTRTEKLRRQSATCLATAMYLLKGTPFLYQGEEIGMTNCPFPDAGELRDVESLNLLRQAGASGRMDWAWQGVRSKGRDNARTPMQWDASPNGGFTDGTPWIMVNPNVLQINVAAAIRDPDSVLHYYRALLALRREQEILQYGEFALLVPEHPQVFAYVRTLEGQEIRVYCNFTDQDAPLPEAICKEKVLLTNVNNDKTGVLLPYETVVVMT